MKIFITLALSLALASVEAFAQATAQIHGTVQDMSGAAIPGANVKATQAETGLARNTTSDADGNYVLTNLPLGPCSSQPPRSHRRFRSVHRAYGDVPGVVLLFCDRARPPQDPALQRHTAPVDWVVQQLREAFPEAAPYRYVILDRDSIFDANVVTFLKATGLRPKRTGVQSPWQNGTAERWIGSCRREMLEHVIALNERHRAA